MFLPPLREPDRRCPRERHDGPLPPRHARWPRRARRPRMSPKPPELYDSRRRRFSFDGSQIGEHSQVLAHPGVTEETLVVRQLGHLSLGDEQVALAVLAHDVDVKWLVGVEAKKHHP